VIADFFEKKWKPRGGAGGCTPGLIEKSPDFEIEKMRQHLRCLPPPGKLWFPMGTAGLRMARVIRPEA
jgi:hypothetical protein